MDELRKGLERNLNLSHLSIEQAPDAILWIDSSGRIHRVNRAACQLLGYSQDELLSIDISELHRESEKLWSERWSDLREKGGFPYEGRLFAKGGRSITAEVSGSFIEFEGEEYLCCFVRDIAGRRCKDEDYRDALAELERLGSSHTIKIDTRIVAATNRDLERAVAEGRFREDLYYRLNVFPIYIIPLRERKDDIPMLVQYFVEKYSAKVGRKIDRIPQKAMEQLQAYHWPGNVRELENVIERAVIISRGGQLETGRWLVREGTASEGPNMATMEEVEREHITRILKQTKWRVSGDKGAAKILGMNPHTLFSRMKKPGITRPT